MTARFTLDGSLLIRTEGADTTEPDMIHQRARQATGADAAILAGTSLAGALRGRARRIARTLQADPQHPAADTLIETIFGTDMARWDEARKVHGSDKQLPPPHASRLRVSEQAVEGGEQHLVQPRVSIDPFTGGARETALFSEQPVFSNGCEAGTEITLRLKRPTDEQIGLLLLTLKDLWTHDLPVGGESSVGRGRWRGEWATMMYQQPDDGDKPSCLHEWTLRRAGNDCRGTKLELPPNAAELETFVAALHHWIAVNTTRKERA